MITLHKPRDDRISGEQDLLDTTPFKIKRVISDGSFYLLYLFLPISNRSLLYLFYVYSVRKAKRLRLEKQKLSLFV